MNARELATVLAALRMFQGEKTKFRNAMPHFENVKPLNNEEIDGLCERLNTSSKDEIHIVWNLEDIKGQAENDGVELTDDEAREILTYLHRKHDASIGINWGVISVTIAEHKSKED